MNYFLPDLVSVLKHPGGLCPCGDGCDNDRAAIKSANNLHALSSHSFQRRWISFEKISLIPIDEGKIGSVTDADARAVGGGGTNFGRVLGETTGTGHHADIGLLVSGARGC